MAIPAKDKLLKARVQIGLRYPFYSFIASRMEFIEREGIGTAATDGRDMWYEPAFIDTLTIEQTVGLIVHEVLHCAWLHPLRLLGRNPKIWNIAGDIAINQIAIDQGITLPEKGIYGPQYDKYKNWAVDSIYADLLKNAVEIKVSFPNPDGQEDGDDSEKMWGGIIQPSKDGKPMTKEEVAELESEMKINVAQAAQYAKSRGKMPGGLQGLIEAVGKPKINWQAYIQQWVKGQKPDNYTWQRPNRKMLVNHGVYMPRMQMQGCGVGVLSIDTSGSVSDEELRAYVREIAGVIDMCNPEKLIIIQHDSRITSITEWEGNEDFKDLKIKGRGGTCIAPVFRHIDRLDEEVDWMIVFSDMEIGDWPAAKDWPNYPVLLCATGRDSSPKGAGATYLPLKDAMGM